MSKDLIKQNFGRVWPAHVSNFVDHLILCRRLTGDLDLLLVLGVIGDRTLSVRKTHPGLTFKELMQDKIGKPAPEAINVQSISDYSGIPRETVRRKVAELIERGWVNKSEEGYLDVTTKCSTDLAPTLEHGVEYLANMMDMLNDLQSKA